MSASREKQSTNAAREVVASLVRLHGFKRGIAHASGALGCSESWARKIHYGEALLQRVHPIGQGLEPEPILHG